RRNNVVDPRSSRRTVRFGRRADFRAGYQIFGVVVGVPADVQLRLAVRRLPSMVDRTTPRADAIEHSRLNGEMWRQYATRTRLRAVDTYRLLSETYYRLLDYGDCYTAFDGPAVLAHGSGSIER